MAAKKRMENFIDLQKAALTELVEPHLNIINAKQSTMVSNNKKASVWADIACQMNGRFPFFWMKRTGAQLKEAYKKAMSKANGIHTAF